MPFWMKTPTGQEGTSTYIRRGKKPQRQFILDNKSKPSTSKLGGSLNPTQCNF